MTRDEAKQKFMDECEVWADLLVEDAERQVANHGVRFSPDLAILPELYVVRPCLRDPRQYEVNPWEFPVAQTCVWLAGYQLLFDAYDAIQSEKGSK